MENHIIIYDGEEGKSGIEVNFSDENFWLTQDQIATLFEKDRSVISKHLSNIFKSGELDEKSNVQKMHIANSDKPIKLYSLDAILSVGYRVNSKKGTHFRRWANSILKNYLVEGYAVNEKLLKEKVQKIQELQHLIKMMSDMVHRTTSWEEMLTGDQATGLFNILTSYSYALEVLDKYDHQKLDIRYTSDENVYVITYEEAIEAIGVWREKVKASQLFGREKDASFRSSINTIYQSFGGEELYPSVEEKAANLLYFVVKNHSFSDGNKRIAAFLFIWFLDKNRMLYRPDGSKRIGDNTLVAMTLMIAESKPEEKEMMIKVVVNLINRNN